METNTVSSKKFAINGGLILGLIGIVIGVVKYVTNTHLEQNPIEMVIATILTIGVLIYTFKEFKKASGGFMSLGRALKLGMGVILISTLIAVVWNFVMMNVIEPDMLSQMQEIQMEKMIEDNPNLTQTQIDAAREMSAKFSSPAIIAAFQIAISLIFGFIITLITGLVMKRDNPHA